MTTMPVEPHAAIHVSCKTTRLGVILSGFSDDERPVLKYLITHLNVVQRSWEFEILPVLSNPLLDALEAYAGLDAPFDREEYIHPRLSAFRADYSAALDEEIAAFGLAPDRPDLYVIISTATFADNYYSMRRNKTSLIALGNWHDKMSPPSIFEFVVTLLMREAVARKVPGFTGSIHYGTKGCLFDFTPSIRDARYKVLNGHVCSTCRQTILDRSDEVTWEDLTKVLKKDWFGKESEPLSPAAVAKKFGSDLFLAHGLQLTRWQKFLDILTQDGVKELIKLVCFVIGGLLLATFLFKLGLKPN